MKKVKVKYHNRINKKTGKISHIGEHQRTVSRIQKIKDFVKNNIDKEINKQDIIRFVVKDLGIIDREKIKKISNLFYSSFNKKQLNERNVNEKNTDEKNIKTDFVYYFSNGNKIDDFIKTERNLDVGDIFYNQKINKNETWKETLKRQGLQIINLEKILEGSSSEKGKKYLVNIMVPIKNGKVLKIEKKSLYEKEIFNLLKRGK